MKVSRPLLAAAILVIVAFIGLLILTCFTGEALGEAPAVPQQGQILAAPVPPHRALNGPSDAATPDPEPTHTAHPVGTRNRTSPVRLNSSDEAFLRCIIQRESGGRPRAQNPHSTASGLVQFLDGTWRSYARESGIGTQYRRAMYAPPEVQLALARWVIKHKGRYPWNGGWYRC